METSMSGGEWVAPKEWDSVNKTDYSINLSNDRVGEVSLREDNLQVYLEVDKVSKAGGVADETADIKVEAENIVKKIIADQLNLEDGSEEFERQIKIAKDKSEGKFIINLNGASGPLGIDLVGNLIYFVKGNSECLPLDKAKVIVNRIGVVKPQA